VTTYNLLGRVQAIQYTGTNVAAIRALLAPRWLIYSADSGGKIALSVAGSESLTLNGNLVSPGQWLVSLPSYDSAVAPSISDGFSVITSDQFAQQYA
jgi:hypothetical protein